MRSLYIDDNAKVLVYERGGYVFAVNFHPVNSYDGYYLVTPEEGKYKVVLNSDRPEFGGYDRISEDYVYTSARYPDGAAKCRIYLPARTGLIMKKIR